MKFVTKNKTFRLIVKMASIKDPFWWFVDTYDCQRALLLSIMLIQKKNKSGIQIIFGPLNIIFGWTHN